MKLSKYEGLHYLFFNLSYQFWNLKSLKQKLKTFYFQDKEDPGKVADLLSEDTLDAELDKRAYHYLETRYILK